MNSDFTFIDLYAGIGGFRLALTNLGGRAVGFSEIDKSALKVYNANFDTSDEVSIGDISLFDGEIYGDIVVGGVPCQPWSSAGLNRGFDDERGRLWISTIKFIEKVRPKGFCFENVKGLQDPRNKSSLEFIITSLEKLGYSVSCKLINAFEMGIPQNRERVFIVGIMRDDLVKEFSFPSRVGRVLDLGSYLGLKNKRDRIKIPDKSRGHLISGDSNRGRYYTFTDIRDGETSIHSWDLKRCSKRDKLICQTILKNRRKKLYGERDGNPISYSDLKLLIKDLKKDELERLVKFNILRRIDGKYDFCNSKNLSGIDGVYRIFSLDSLIFPTITRTGGRDFISTERDFFNSKEEFVNNIYKKSKYRSLTLTEACKLQSFPAKFDFTLVPESVAFGLLGNAVPVFVVEKVIKSMLESMVL